MKPNIIKNATEVVAIIADFERNAGVIVFQEGQQPRRAINLGLSRTVEGFPCVRYAVPGRTKHALLVVDELTRNPYVFHWINSDCTELVSYLAA